MTILLISRTAGVLEPCTTLKMTRIMVYILNALLVNMKVLFMLLMLPFLLSACSSSNKRSDQEQQTTYSLPTNMATNLETISEITPEQQSAFDALNTLQVSTDEMNRLYSTFANITQPCYPADTSFIITQSELLIYMKQFVSQNCQNLKEAIRNELAETSVLAQEEYTVFYCGGHSSIQNYNNGPPMLGTWVMSGILGRRDVILVW